MKRKERANRMEEALVNLTPLIDVVFVVLIMFILVAPMLELDNVELAASGEKPEKMSPRERDVTVHVHNDNTIWINKNRVDIKQLARILVRLRQQWPDSKVRLFQDKRAQFGTYQMVKNAAEAAGFPAMDVVLQPM